MRPFHLLYSTYQGPYGYFKPHLAFLIYRPKLQGDPEKHENLSIFCIYHIWYSLGDKVKVKVKGGHIQYYWAGDPCVNVP